MLWLVTGTTAAILHIRNVRDVIILITASCELLLPVRDVIAGRLRIRFLDEGSLCPAGLGSVPNLLDAT